MAHILIIYSTTDGHTRRICERLKAAINNAHDVTLAAMPDAPDVDVATFDKVVIGASIRYGKHQKQVFEFIDRNQSLLERKPNAFFTVNLVARKAEKNTPDTNPYMQKFLTQINWTPANLAVFAGKVDYPRYGFVDRTIIRFIMWMTDGPTDPSSIVEYTDWDTVDEFAATIASM